MFSYIKEKIIVSAPQLTEIQRSWKIKLIYRITLVCIYVSIHTFGRRIPTTESSVAIYADLYALR